MHPGIVAKAHRLLAPRIAYLIGTRSSEGEPNLIPVSNVTSVSTNPQLVLIAVYKQWQTFINLTVSPGFTLSVPAQSQLDGVWKLGATYSRFDFANRQAKLDDCGLSIADDREMFGPILTDGLGWLSCRTVHQTDFGGDHGIFVGEVDDVTLNTDVFAMDGTPHGELHPLMQVTGNLFTTASQISTIDYGH
jgi:flavin reductase (DIM6/NTAB) family NADH-FMN oxidoreductase RutF